MAVLSMGEVKEYAKKFWHFLWKEESVASWLVNIVLAYILIKFIVYPGLGFLLNTSFPVVAVVSGSMEHDGSFDEWWNSRAVCTNSKCTQSEWYTQYGITKELFLDFYFHNGFNTGDIMILYGKAPKDIKIGDILVFQNWRPEPIIHRVVNIEIHDGRYMFQTKGDHNQDSSGFDRGITQEKVVGTAVIRIPYLGRSVMQVSISTG